jgi:hypothetical protein
MKCCEPGCDFESQYDSPKNWCTAHWSSWWFEGVLEDAGKLYDKQFKDKLKKISDVQRRKNQLRYK